jgi:RNA-directed DNA polymerase
LETDIAKCFDKINHEYLISKTPMADKHVLRQMLKSGISVKGKLEKSLEGTPQGGVISPMLCNVALNGMEATIRKFFEKSRDKVDKITGERSKVNVIRYADDLIITGSSKEILVF